MDQRSNTMHCRRVRAAWMWVRAEHGPFNGARLGAILAVTLGTGFGCQAQVEPSYQGEPLIELEGRIEALTGAAQDTDVGVLWLTGDADNGCSGPTLDCSNSASTGAGSANTDFECLAACGDPPPAECTEDAAELGEQWAQCQTACGSDTQYFISVRSRTCFQGGVAQTTPVAGEFPADFSLDVLQPPPEEALMVSDTGERAAVAYFVAVDSNADGLSISREDREPPAWLFGASETHALMYAAEPISEDSAWGKHLGGAYDEGYHLVQVIYGNRCGLPSLDAHDTADQGSDMPPSVTGGEPSVSAADGGSPEEAPTDDEYLEPDYRGIPFVCGNGVCERNENCDICSDCVECDAEGQGRNSNLTSRESDDFHCFSSENQLVPAAPNAEAEILLKLADPRSIDWPRL